MTSYLRGRSRFPLSSLWLGSGRLELHPGARSPSLFSPQRQIHSHGSSLPLVVEPPISPLNPDTDIQTPQGLFPWVSTKNLSLACSKLTPSPHPSTHQTPLSSTSMASTSASSLNLYSVSEARNKTWFWLLSFLHPQSKYWPRLAILLHAHRYPVSTQHHASHLETPTKYLYWKCEFAFRSIDLYENIFLWLEGGSFLKQYCSTLRLSYNEIIFSALKRLPELETRVKWNGVLAHLKNVAGICLCHSIPTWYFTTYKEFQSKYVIYVNLNMIFPKRFIGTISNFLVLHTL